MFPKEDVYHPELLSLYSMDLSTIQHCCHIDCDIVELRSNQGVTSVDSAMGGNSGVRV